MRGRDPLPCRFPWNPLRASTDPGTGRLPMLKGSFWRWLQSLPGGPRRRPRRPSRGPSRGLSRPVLEGLEDRLTPATPLVSSIGRDGPALTGATSVDFTVTFDRDVSDVDAGDFRVSTTGTARADGGLSVTPVSRSVYIVTALGLRGHGGLRLALAAADSINNAGDPLGGPGLATGSSQGDAYQVLQAAPRVVSIDRFSPTGVSTSATSVNFLVTFSE